MRMVFLAIAALLLAAPAAAGDDVPETKWEKLIPAGWNAEQQYKDLKIDKLDDNDPRALDAVARLRAAWDNAPVVEELNGQRIKLPGFVVTLEVDDKGAVTEFLLVPYFGACIHVPPPPANQVVHVLAAKPVPEDVAIYPVHVTGTMETVHADTEYGAAGYRISGAVVEQYKEK